MSINSHLIAQTLTILLIGWLAALAFAVVIRILRGDINTTGMLRTRPGAGIDPERATMMLTTLLVIGGYALDVLSNGAIENPVTGKDTMPDAPQELLLIMGGGNILYLTGKIGRRITGKD